MKKNFFFVSLIVVTVISVAFLPLGTAVTVIITSLFMWVVFSCVYIGARAETNLRVNDPEGAKALDRHREMLAEYDMIINASMRY